MRFLKNINSYNFKKLRNFETPLFKVLRIKKIFASGGYVHNSFFEAVYTFKSISTSYFE